MKESLWQALRFLGLYAGLVGLWWVVKAAHENFSQEWMAWGLPLFVLLGALAIWKGPQWQTRHLAGQGVEPKDRHQLADTNRRTIKDVNNVPSDFQTWPAPINNPYVGKRCYRRDERQCCNEVSRIHFRQ